MLLVAMGLVAVGSLTEAPKVQAERVDPWVVSIRSCTIESQGLATVDMLMTTRVENTGRSDLFVPKTATAGVVETAASVEDVTNNRVESSIDLLHEAVVTPRREPPSISRLSPHRSLIVHMRVPLFVRAASTRDPVAPEGSSRLVRVTYIWDYGGADGGEAQRARLKKEGAVLEGTGRSEWIAITTPWLRDCKAPK